MFWWLENSKLLCIIVRGKWDLPLLTRDNLIRKTTQNGRKGKHENLNKNIVFLYNIVF